MIGKYDNIIVIGATNRLDDVDGAIKRSGRFDKWIEIPLPNKEGRQEIFKIHTKGAQRIANGYNPESPKLFSDDIDFDSLSSITENLSGADIAEIVQRTLEAKANKDCENGHRPPPVSTSDLEEQIDKYEKIANKDIPTYIS
mgnify:FL=1